MNLRYIFVTAVLALLLLVETAPAAQAQLSLNFSGITSGSSIGGTFIPDGTPFTLHLHFSLPMTPGSTGVGVTTVTGITGSIGATPFTGVSQGLVFLEDPTNGDFPGFYYPSFVIPDGSGVLGALFSSATPAFDPLAPTPTVFSGYAGRPVNGIEFLTSLGDTGLAYDASRGLAASITSLAPEPGAFALVGGALPMVIGLVVRRRRK